MLHGNCPDESLLVTRAASWNIRPGGLGPTRIRDKRAEDEE
jgi:hypothetical protein